MITIRDRNDFRLGYELLGVLTEFVEDRFERTDVALEKIIKTKRELRRWAARDNTEDMGGGLKVERRIVKDEGMDGYVELVSIPKAIETKEDAYRFFKDYIEIECWPSMYDCTGQAFTCWYKLFKRRGQFWAYHGVGFDF